MAIKDKTTESTSGQGFGAQDAPKESPQDAGQLAKVIQNSAVQKVVTMVQSVDAGLQELEAAGAEAILARESQVGVRVLDKVAAGVIAQSQADEIPNTAALSRQLTQALFEVNRSESWRTCTPDDMARSNLLFGTPADAMKNARALPSS